MRELEVLGSGSTWPKKTLDKRYTDMITFVMLARQITLSNPPNQANSFAPTLLQSLGSLFAISVVYFQQLAASFCKTPGWGVPVQVVRRVVTPPLIDFHLPLFSQTYKPLFPQLLCFHIYTKPPGGGVKYHCFHFRNPSP